MNRNPLLAVAVIILISAPASIVWAADGPTLSTVVDQLEWRNIGPANMGGRIDDFAVVESDPRIIYVATLPRGSGKQPITPSPGSRSSTISP